ncbi:transposase, partial [Enterococcus faecalis]
VRLMKTLATSSRQYHALKRYWKLLLTPANHLNYEAFRKWTNFPYPATATDVVDALLDIDPELKQTYDVMNWLRETIKNRDWPNYNQAFHHLQGCSEEMLAALQTLAAHHDEIGNTF